MVTAHNGTYSLNYEGIHQLMNIYSTRTSLSPKQNYMLGTKGYGHILFAILFVIACQRRARDELQS